MFIIFLRFSDNFANAKQFMPAHNEWIKRGIEDGIFHLVGSIAPNQGGAIITGNLGRPEIENIIASDPFVANDIVKAEIFEISPNKTSKELQFLLN